MAIKHTLAAIACLSVFSFAALPDIRITTKDNQNPDGNSGGWGMGGTTTYKYFALSSFQLTDSSNNRNNITSSTNLDSIKVRGNSTAGMSKKPYRVKFGEKKSPFGKEAARSWVLLANYYDATFALNAMAFELGKRLGLEFTNSSQLVNLWINGTYKGIYQLTEQIQSHKGRVDLKEKHNGWLAEFDYHDPAADEKNSWFKTSNYDMGTYIKAPELDDTIPNRPTSYIQFVKDDINNLVKKMSESGFPNNGYRDLIDLDSWAKYVLIQLVMDNFDFNSKAQAGYLLGSNYAYKIESCDKIKAGPLWDFDLAAGLERISGGGFGGSFPTHYKTYQDSIAPTHAFYRRLWEDPVFKAKYKKTWDAYKSQFQSMGAFIDDIKSQLDDGNNITGKGNNVWNSGTLTQQKFDSEVRDLKTWWTNRLNWVDQKLTSYNIDTSKDITQASTCNTSSSSKASSSSATPSSSSNAVSSSSSITVSNPTCTDYQSSWCGNTVPAINTTTTPTLGQCVFVKDYTSLMVSSGGGTILINGVPCEGSYANCVAIKPEAIDGGYYIYIQAGRITTSQNYTVVPGAPDCNGGTPIISSRPVNLQGAKVEVYNLQGKLVYSGYGTGSKSEKSGSGKRNIHSENHAWV